MHDLYGDKLRRPIFFPIGCILAACAYLPENLESITNRRDPLTDRLFAVLRERPGVTFDRRPRKLYYRQG